MHEDPEGFLYPEVDTSLCIDCHLCEKVCPVLHPGGERRPLASYAAVNRDERVRLSSSSGGVFTALAEKVIARGGVVFGARFDDNFRNVVHDCADTLEGLAVFWRAKYVQSRVGDSFQSVERFLKAGRKVLFSGTPCQIAGLRNFLRKDYPLLLTADVICHGVPSPGVWRQYMKEDLQERFPGLDVKIKRLSFRDKTNGWKTYSFTYDAEVNGRISRVSEASSRNAFMRGFLADLYLRPSCHACPSKCLKSGSDLTVGDYWGVEQVHRELDDDKGVSVVMANTAKGQDALKQLTPGVSLTPTRYEDVCRFNPAVVRAAKRPAKRPTFFEQYGGHGVVATVETLVKPPSLARRIAGRIRRTLGAIYRRMRRGCITD